MKHRPSFSTTVKIAVASAFMAGALGVIATPALAKTSDTSDQPSLGERVSSWLEGLRNGVERTTLRLIPGDKDGKAVFRQAVAAYETVDSYHYLAETDVTAKGTTGEEGTFSFDLDMNAKTNGATYDTSNIEQYGTMKLAATAEGVTLSADGDIIQKGDEAFYFKLNTIPALPGLNASTLKGQWVKLSLDKTAPSNAMMAGAAPTPSLAKADPKKLQEAFEKFYDNVEFSPAKREKRDGINVFVVDMTMQPAAIKTLMEDISKASQSTLTEEQKTQMEEGMKEASKMYDAMEPVKTTMVIGVSNFYLHELATDFSLKLPEPETAVGRGSAPMAPAGLDSFTAAESLNVSVSLKTDKYNEPVTIEIPDNSISIEELMQQYMRSLMGGITLPQALPTATTPTLAAPGNSGSAPGQLKKLEGLTPEQQKMLEELGL